MLKRLLIQNYALINQLEITPSEDLNIITGETGAGKSIMLGAIGLLLGDRADYKALFDESKKCVVEAEFAINQLDLKSVFEKEDIDYDELTIIRREINANGKSRAFINDSPCRLDQLKTIGRKLIDIHSQHETIFLNKSNFQFQLLDGLAQTSQELKAYQKTFSEYTELLQSKKSLLKKIDEQSTDLDYKSFILNELQEINLEELNIEELEQQANLIENTEVIKENIQIALNTITGEESYTSLNTLFNAETSLKQIENLNPSYEELNSRLHGVIEEIKDIAGELEDQQQNLDYDPEEAISIKNKLDSLFHLLNKHKVIGVDHLILLRDSTEKELQEVSNFDQAIEQLEQEIQSCLKQLQIKGDALSKKRTNTAQVVEQRVQELLSEVGIKEGIFKIVLSTQTEPNIYGLDSIRFLFSANKGIQPELLEKTASGGELSRLMFCLKYLTAQKTALPTVIFDEIDSGISGEIAQKMAIMMNKMAQEHQLITITHLPQMASKGSSHYFVYKDQNGEKSLSKIKHLNQEERILEIAQMIGGAHPSSSAIESAKELFLD